MGASLVDYHCDNVSAHVQRQFYDPQIAPGTAASSVSRLCRYGNDSIHPV